MVYASCHCGNYAYSGTYNYSNPIPNASDVNNIKYIGAWDEATGAYLPDFWPSALDTRSGIGGWELTPDSNGCLWFGGDFKQGSYQGTGYQWLGGFGKFCPRDSVAPTVPGNLRSQRRRPVASSSAGTPRPTTPGAVRYELMRDDRVIISTTGLSYIDTTGVVPGQLLGAGGRRRRQPVGHLEQGQPCCRPDTTAPTAAITGPADGTTAYGPVTVTATASDDQAVASVDLLVDGTVVGTATTAPYSFSWNATAVGSHTLQARARDAAGNTGTCRLRSP